MADFLLLEDGVSHLLLEDGSGALLLEAGAAAVARPIAALAAVLVRLARAAVVSRVGKAATVARTALGGYPVPVTGQSLDTIYQGEDVSLRFAISTDPTGWALKFTLIPVSGGSVVVTSTTVSGSSPLWYVNVSLPHATTAALAEGVARVQLHRTDTGSNEMLASGTVHVSTPAATIP